MPSKKAPSVKFPKKLSGKKLFDFIEAQAGEISRKFFGDKRHLLEKNFKGCHLVLQRAEIKSLREQPNNFYPETRKALKALSERKFRSLPPILVYTDGMIHDGHHRYREARRRKQKIIRVYVIYRPGEI